MRALAILTLVLLVGAGSGCAAPRSVEEPAPPGPPPFVDKGAWVEDHPGPRGRYSDKFPDVVLVDQDGERHRFYSDLVRDRIVLIQFFYTECTGI